MLPAYLGLPHDGEGTAIQLLPQAMTPEEIGSVPPCDTSVDGLCELTFLQHALPLPISDLISVDATLGGTVTVTMPTDYTCAVGPTISFNEPCASTTDGGDVTLDDLTVTVNGVAVGPTGGSRQLSMSPIDVLTGTYSLVLTPAPAGGEALAVSVKQYAVFCAYNGFAEPARHPSLASRPRLFPNRSCALTLPSLILLVLSPFHLSSLPLARAEDVHHPQHARLRRANARERQAGVPDDC